MAAGLMNEQQAQEFLEECLAKDEYLTAMALNHCGGIKSALSTEKKIIRKTNTVALLSYWMGNIFEWELVKWVMILLLIAKQVLRAGGNVFQEPMGISKWGTGHPTTACTRRPFTLPLMIVESGRG